MRFHFGPFELDADRFELRRENEPLQIEKRVLDLILLLVRERHRIVPRAEIGATLWPTVHVDDNHGLDQALYTARRALGDVARDPAYILTVRGRGLQFICPVHAVESRPAKPIPIIGRNAVLSRLSSLVSASSPVPRLVVVAGEPGIGKTRLVEEFFGNMRAQEIRCALVRCGSLVGGTPLWPWRSAIDQLTRSDEGPLESHSRLDARVSDAERDVGRWELFRAMTIALREATAGHAAIILDDLHVCDHASTRMLPFVLSADLPGVLVVATCRLHDFHLGEASLDGMRLNVDLVTRLDAERIDLEGLDPHATTHFASSYLGRSVGLEESKWLHSNSGGNPLFLRHLCASLDEGARSYKKAPRSLRQLIGARIQAIDRQVRETLEAASVVGSEFSERVLREILGREVERDLDSAEAAGIVDRSDGDRWAFVHDLMREQLWSRLPTPTRARFHRQCVEAIEQLEGSAVASELARHAYLAGSAIDPQKVVRLLEEAARWALANYAYEDAVEFFRQALERRRTIDGDVLSLELELGRALLLAGRRRDARSQLLATCRLAESQERWEICGQAALAVAPGLFSIEAGIADPVAISMLRSALAGIEGEPSTELKVLLLGRLAMAMYWDRSQAGERRRLISEALSMMERVDVSDGVWAEFVSYRIGAMWSAENWSNRYRLSRRLIELADRARQTESALIGHVYAVATMMERGDVEEAILHVGALRNRLEESPLPQAMWYPAAYEAMLEALWGNFDRAEEAAKKVLRLGDGSNDANVINTFAPMLVFLRWQQRRLGEVLGVMASLVERFTNVPAWRVGYALMCWESGRRDAAREAYSGLIRSWEGWDENLTWLLSVGMLGDLCVELGDRDGAERLIEAVAKGQGGAMGVGYGVGYWGSVDRVVGRLAGCMGDAGAAAESLGRAIEFERRMGAPVWRARAELDLAEVLLWSGRDRSIDEARGLVRGVREEARQKGFSMLAERAAEQEKKIVARAGE